MNNKENDVQEKPKSFKVNRLNGSDDILAVDASFRKVKVLYERTGEKYILKETPNHGLQLTK